MSKKETLSLVAHPMCIDLNSPYVCLVLNFGDGMDLFFPNPYSLAALLKSNSETLLLKKVLKHWFQNVLHLAVEKLMGLQIVNRLHL